VSIIWIFLWGVFSFIILGATFWNLSILFNQKKAWKEYADKKGLMFQKGSFAGPCAMDGTIDGYQISLFTAEQQNTDARKSRKVTGIQVNLDQPFINSLGAGTGEMITFLKSIPNIKPHEIQSKSWSSQHFIFSQNTKAIEGYLTDDRLDALNKMLGMKGADVLFLADGNGAVLRCETSNPLSDAKLLEKLISATLKRFEALKADKKEIKKLSEFIVEEDNDDLEEDSNKEDVSSKNEDENPEQEKLKPKKKAAKKKEKSEDKETKNN